MKRVYIILIYWVVIAFSYNQFNYFNALIKMDSLESNDTPNTSDDTDESTKKLENFDGEDKIYSSFDHNNFKIHSQLLENETTKRKFYFHLKLISSPFLFGFFQPPQLG